MLSLTNDEKTTLIVLTVSAVIMVFVILYLNTNEPIDNFYLNRRIHVIHTSGGAEEDFEQTYVKNKEKIGHYDVHTYDPVLSSSDIANDDLNKIAGDIGSAYNKYDVFIIICGRDTLPYTASALSFMLENLAKPVILTDGELTSTLLLATTTKIPEVMVSSGGKLLRGARSIASSTKGFSSPNYPALNTETSLVMPKGLMQIKFMNPKVKIIVVKVFPGMDGKYISSIAKNKPDGIVLETYGVGRSPITEKILENISKISESGIVIINVSQCNKMDQDFDTDIRLLEAGVLGGNDMTTAAAFSKLSYLLSNVEDRKLIGQLLETNFRGEMSA
jgi:L-asparaginase